MTDLPESELGFDWDQGNLDKNWFKHQISLKESEEAFLDLQGLVSADPVHSHTELRWFLLAKTKSNKLLSIFFTYRKNKIRIISARPMSRKEKQRYENQKI
jgi:hypothetical protein